MSIRDTVTLKKWGRRVIFCIKIGNGNSSANSNICRFFCSVTVSQVFLPFFLANSNIPHLDETPVENPLESCHPGQGGTKTYKPGCTISCFSMIRIYCLVPCHGAIKIFLYQYILELDSINKYIPDVY